MFKVRSEAHTHMESDSDETSLNMSSQIMSEHASHLSVEESKDSDK
jgi:hypothetical protein